MVKKLRESFFKQSVAAHKKIRWQALFHLRERKTNAKSEGPIPEGEYYITPLSENIDDGVQYWNKIGYDTKNGWVVFCFNV